jgi:hypothetical protein
MMEQQYIQQPNGKLLSVNLRIIFIMNLVLIWGEIMDKLQIMNLANMLMDALENCSDWEFVDEVLARVSSNEPFIYEDGGEDEEECYE